MLQSDTVPGLLEKRAEESKGIIAYWIRGETWSPVTWDEFYQDVLKVSNGLIAMGVQKGFRLGIMASSSYQWELAHMAILASGGVVVGLDPNEPPEHLEHMVKIANIDGLIIDQSERLAKFTRETRDKFKFVLEFNSINTVVDKGTKHFYLDNLLKDQRYEHVEKHFLERIEASDIATIIFTSGTTGQPKAIPYRHHQILFACSGILNIYQSLNETCHMVCWLPLSNLFQRIVNLCAMTLGAQTYFVDEPKKITEYLPQINPHIFIAVPRFYEKLNEGLEGELAKQPKVIASFIYYCLSQAESPGVKGEFFKLLCRLLLKNFRQIFGTNMSYMISGSAPMPLWLLKRFDALGLPVFEAYGMSENILPIALNSPENYKYGTVGKPIPGNQIEILDDNELRVRGVGVFDGYLGNELSVDLDDGFLATGDYAEMTDDGFIRLIGRKSDVFKTSTGRKISPVSIESLLLQVPEIEQVVIFGANQKFLIAVVTLVSNAIEFNNDFKKKILATLEGLPAYQRPGGVVLSTQQFTLKNKEMTSNLKLRRKVIQSNYAPYIDSLYLELANNKSEINQGIIEINTQVRLLKL